MLCLSLLVVVIDNTILNTALPTLARVLHAGTSSLQWITDAYTLCFAALLVPAGALGDRYGRRLSLIGGLAVFALGSTAAAFASGTGMLIAARVVMGLGAAFVMPATLSILNAVFPPQERPQAIAAWSAVAGVGIVIGPTLGGLLLSHFWWGSVFLINVPLVALALAGVLLTVPETAEPGGHRLDFAGTLLVAGALFAARGCHHRGPQPRLDRAVDAGRGGRRRWPGWPCSPGGSCASAHPLIDLRVFAVRAFSAAAASVTVIFFALFGSLFVLTQYLQLVHGYSPLSAGVRALPFAIAMAAVSPVSPVLAGRLGSRVIIPAGIVLMGARPAGPVHGRRAHELPAAGRWPWRSWAPGMGLVMAPASTTIMTTVPAHQAGAGSAINDTIREVGGALGVAIVGSLAEDVYRSRLGSALAAAHVPERSSPGRQLGRRGGHRRAAGGRRRRRRAGGRGAHRVHHGHGHRHADGRGGGPDRRGRGRRRPAAAPEARAAAGPGRAAGHAEACPGALSSRQPGPCPDPAGQRVRDAAAGLPGFRGGHPG